MKIISWNVNGLRACGEKGFTRWLGRCGAEIVGVQEVRARLVDIPRNLAKPKGWFTHFVEAKKPGYSGVGLYSRHEPDELTTSIGAPEHDDEGRVQIARFGALVVVNCYFPNGKGSERDNSRVPFKLAFYRRLLQVIEERRARGHHVVVMGDFNTAHREIDLARPKGNRDISGFLPEERAELDRWFSAGWFDTFRHLNEQPHEYTWWSNRPGVRESNVGWRIDLVVASETAKAHLREAFILQKVRGSDHCPVGVTLDPSIVEARTRVRA